MKRFISLMLCLLIIAFSVYTVSASEATRTTTPRAASTTVYITKTGNKYHRKKCRTTTKSKITAMKLSKAKAQGYKACKVCKPPAK